MHNHKKDIENECYQNEEKMYETDSDKENELIKLREKLSEHDLNQRELTVMEKNIKKTMKEFKVKLKYKLFENRLFRD